MKRISIEDIPCRPKPPTQTRTSYWPPGTRNDVLYWSNSWNLTGTASTEAKCGVQLGEETRCAARDSSTSWSPLREPESTRTCENRTRFVCDCRMSVCFLTRATCKNVRQNLMPRATA